GATAALVRARSVGRPSLAAASTATIARWLEEDRALPSGEIVRRLQQEDGYRGGKSALYELIRRLRPVPVAPLVRFEGVPGEFSQHDFGMVSVRFVNRRRRARSLLRQPAEVESLRRRHARPRRARGGADPRAAPCLGGLPGRAA